MSKNARPNEFGQTLRAKINVCGDKAGDLWNAGVEQTEAPVDFRAISFNAMCLVRGVYVMKTSIGLMVDVVSMQYEDLKMKAAAQVECPFVKATIAD